MALPDLILPGAGGGAGRETKAQQAEFVRSPAEYLNPKTLANLMASGQALDKQWGATLAKIEQQYGVPRTMVLAIWGRETAYGTYKPPHYAIKVLATQAYLGRRKERFREELILALKMIEERHVTIPEFKASWAGAFGLTQFMPTDFYKFAVDFDGDGKRDLFHSVPDALASAAVAVVEVRLGERQAVGLGGARAQDPGLLAGRLGACAADARVAETRLSQGRRRRRCRRP